MSLSLLRFANEIRALNPFTKVDVESSRPGTQGLREASKRKSISSFPIVLDKVGGAPWRRVRETRHVRTFS
jgi:hypothetical protein